MPRKALSAATALLLLAASAASAHAQLRLNLRATPQVRVTPSPGGAQFAPKGGGSGLSGPNRQRHGHDGGTFVGTGPRNQNSEGGVSGFTRKVIGVTK